MFQKVIWVYQAGCWLVQHRLSALGHELLVVGSRLGNAQLYTGMQVTVTVEVASWLIQESVAVG